MCSIQNVDLFYTPVGSEDDEPPAAPPPPPARRRSRRAAPEANNITSETICIPAEPNQLSLSSNTVRRDIVVQPSTSSQNTVDQSVQNSNDCGENTNKVKCDQCSQPRYFKGTRGLKIHISRVHRTSSPSQITNSTSDEPHSFTNTLSHLKNNLPIIRRIPRGARPLVARCLTEDIKYVLATNSSQAWEHLLTFPYRILHVPKNPSDPSSLTNRIKQNCTQNSKKLPTFSFTSPSLHSVASSSISFRMVENKLSDGDIKGSARLLFSNDTIAPYTSDTLQALKDKHPPSPALQEMPLPPVDSDEALIATYEDVMLAISSFPSGSAGGIDALSPQHLKDLVSGGSGEDGDALLREITNLSNFMLSGKVNVYILPILYGANLCALLKKDKSIRPIAVGSVYRRLTAKICCKSITNTLSAYFQPVQLGFGSRGGCEAAVHSLRSFLTHNAGDVLVKVDVRNAFNSVNRDVLLSEIKDKIPFLYKYLWHCYGQPSKLFYKNDIISSEVGCQQGDPTGPAIFSLAIHPILKKLTSKFNVWYLDDGTFGGDVSTVSKDLELLVAEFEKIGLSLNFSKCELYIANPNISKFETIDMFRKIAPNIKILENNTLRLLGSPILDESIPDFVSEKIQNFLSISDRLQKINSHMAYYIIRYCLFVPKFIYFLRCCQLWKQPLLLQQFDNVLKDTLSTILNINFDDRSWCQASLPIRHGGLGIRKISSISLPAFLSSVHSTKHLINLILSSSLDNFDFDFMAEAQESWYIACPEQDLPKDLRLQKLWDGPLCEIERKKLIDTSNSQSERARLLACMRWESGLWLQALPSKNIGNLLDNNTFRSTVALRLGAPCQVPHRCPCGDFVDRLGHHGLSCSKSAGRFSRHASLNDIIRRACVSAGIPSVLEPQGLMRDDGKRPDGMTLIPWKMGRPLVWDATCVDTLAPSHLPETSIQAGGAASKAENLKRRKYSNLDRGYMFVPFGVETLGPWGSSAHEIFRDLAKRLVEATSDQNAGLYLAQKLSLAIQRGNAASILGTFSVASGLSNF